MTGRCQAGVAVVGVRSAGWVTDDLAGAVTVVEGPAHLVTRLDETPLGRTGVAEPDAA